MLRYCILLSLSHIMIAYNDVKALCTQRRSIRYFSEQEVSKQTIEDLLAIAHVAPSVENTQPWHFHCITNKKLRENAMSASCYGNFILGASVFIVVTCDRSATPTSHEIIWNPKELEYSCAAAMQNLTLAATSMSLGSSWVSLHHGQIHDMLTLQAHQIVIGGMMIGYMRAGEEYASTRHVRSPLKEKYTFYT